MKLIICYIGLAPNFLPASVSANSHCFDDAIERASREFRNPPVQTATSIRPAPPISTHTELSAILSIRKVPGGWYQNGVTLSKDEVDPLYREAARVRGGSIVLGNGSDSVQTAMGLPSFIFNSNPSIDDLNGLTASSFLSRPGAHPSSDAFSVLQYNMILGARGASRGWKYDEKSKSFLRQFAKNDQIAAKKAYDHAFRMLGASEQIEIDRAALINFARTIGVTH